MHVASHLPHTGTVSRRLFAAYSQDAYVLGAEVAMRADGNFTHIGKIASFHEQASQPQQVQTFANYARNSRALNHHVGAAALSQLSNAIEPRAFRKLARVDHMIGAKLAGKFETEIRKINGNDRACAEHPC